MPFAIEKNIHKNTHKYLSIDHRTSYGTRCKSIGVRKYDSLNVIGPIYQGFNKIGNFFLIHCVTERMT